MVTSIVYSQQPQYWDVNKVQAYSAAWRYHQIMPMVLSCNIANWTKKMWRILSSKFCSFQCVWRRLVKYTVLKQCVWQNILYWNYVACTGGPHICSTNFQRIMFLLAFNWVIVHYVWCIYRYTAVITIFVQQVRKGRMTSTIFRAVRKGPSCILIGIYETLNYF